MRKQFTAQQKVTVALAALAGDKTVNQVAAAYEIHPTQVKQWRDIMKQQGSQQRTINVSMFQPTSLYIVSKNHRLQTIRNWAVEREHFPSTGFEKLFDIL